MNKGDGLLWQIGRCGYCGCRFEDYDPAHMHNRCWRKVVLEQRALAQTKSGGKKDNE